MLGTTIPNIKGYPFMRSLGSLTYTLLGFGYKYYDTGFWIFVPISPPPNWGEGAKYF